MHHLHRLLGDFCIIVFIHGMLSENLETTGNQDQKLLKITENQDQKLLKTTGNQNQISRCPGNVEFNKELLTKHSDTHSAYVINYHIQLYFLIF